MIILFYTKNFLELLLQGLYDGIDEREGQWAVSRFSCELCPTLHLEFESLLKIWQAADLILYIIIAFSFLFMLFGEV